MILGVGCEHSRRCRTRVRLQEMQEHNQLHNPSLPLSCGVRLLTDRCHYFHLDPMWGSRIGYVWRNAGDQERIQSANAVPSRTLSPCTAILNRQVYNTSPEQGCIWYD